MTLTQGDKLNPLGTVPLREIALAAQWFDTTDAHIVIVTGEGRGLLLGFRSPRVRRRRLETMRRRAATRPTSGG